MNTSWQLHIFWLDIVVCVYVCACANDRKSNGSLVGVAADLVTAKICFELSPKSAQIYSRYFLCIAKHHH